MSAGPIDDKEPRHRGALRTAAARATLVAYIAEMERPIVHRSDPRLKRIAKRVLPKSVHEHARLLATDAIMPLSRHRAKRLANRGPVRLHLGSASSRKADWINIDVVGHPVDLAWNLQRRLPFADGAADAVFHEHVLEHFPLRDGLRLTDECARLLRSEGVLRIAVPDTAAYARSYVHGDDFISETRPGRPTRLLAFEEIFFRHGHRVMYDIETLILVLTAAGFAEIEEVHHGKGRLQPCPDSPHRAPESIYVEAVKS